MTARAQVELPELPGTPFMAPLLPGGGYCATYTAAQMHAYAQQAIAESEARAEVDARRLDYIERTFSGMTNRERYLPVQMIWGKGCNGRTLREACDKYMARDDAAQEAKREAGSA